MKYLNNEIKNTLRRGYTTGACAQAAAKAAAWMLVNQRQIDSIEAELPCGIKHRFTLINQSVADDAACCSVIKDSGADTQDITNGIEIVAEVRRNNGKKGIALLCGKGVGVVTFKGLSIAPGEAAINPVPRRMILRDVEAILSNHEGYIVEISVPEGEKIAEKTYNPRLGIKGGISIIGTRGIVEPKSLVAYQESLRIGLNVAYENGHKIIFLASGYIGERLLKEKFAAVPEQAIISMGDYVGFMLDECRSKGIKKVILIGHIGKLVKVAAGIFNTHYSQGDSRLETIAEYAKRNGASEKMVSQIMELKLAEAAVDLLRENDLMKIFDDIAEAVAGKATAYSKNEIEIAAILLTLSGEIIGCSSNIADSRGWEGKKYFLTPGVKSQKSIWDTFIS